MATLNPFDLLGDDAEDPSQQIAAAEKLKVAAPKKSSAQEQGKPGTRNQPSKTAQLPTKPPPPSQAVREAKNEVSRGGRGGGRGAGRGYGRGRGGSGFNRDSSNDENSFIGTGAPAGQDAPEGETGNPSERRGYGGPRGSYRGSRRGGFSNGDGGEEDRPRRVYERRSGTGRGNEFKRDGAGRGNWGTQKDEIAQVTEELVNETEKNLDDEKPVGEGEASNDNKESPANGAEEKEPEEKEMTLEEYEKVLEEKRKALQALKTEGRKVDVKEFQSMQQLSNKKDNDEVFVKLGSDKDKRKEAYEKEDKSRKVVSINEFLKPAEGERYYGGRGRGGRGRGRGGNGGNAASNASALAIEDPGQFPTLGGK